MAYDVSKTDGTRLVIVPDRTTVNVGGINLLGKNLRNYGDIHAENLVRLLENSANTTPPENPLVGQLWYNPGPTKSLSLWSGTRWVTIVTESTGMHPALIRDTANTPHPVAIMRVYNRNIAIVAYNTFTVSDSETEFVADFPRLNPGINFSSATTSGGDLVYKLRGRAIEAEFADMAEIYTADMELMPGNIVKLGGEAEITKTTEEFDNQVFGIVSTAPGFLLNSKDKLKEFAYPVALKGRVPCFVTGQVSKGQRIVASDIAGIGMATNDFDPAATVGRAISEKADTDVGIIEVAVGVR